MPLREPSKELATKLLCKVGFEERLVGARMTPMAGVFQYPIYGFREAVNFLQISDVEEILAAGPTAAIPYVDPGALRDWLDEVFGDTELAEAIGETVDHTSNYVQTMRRISELMRQRLSQCEAVLKNEDLN